MPATATAAPKRDNLFGVCAALGEDFGFDAFYLRVAFAVGVIASPEAVLIAYATAALLVLLSRVLTRRRAAPARTAEIHRLAPAPTEIPAEPLRQAA